MSDLRNTALLHNDPEIALEVFKEAEAGNIDAQYMAGLLFAEGRGVPRDEILSFFWLSLASQQGDEDAMILRTVVASTMTEVQFSKAQQLLHDFQKAGFSIHMLTERKPGKKARPH